MIRWKPSGIKWLIFSALLAFVFVTATETQVRAVLVASGSVSISPSQGEFVLAPQTMSGDHFVSVPGSGMIYVIDCDDANPAEDCLSDASTWATETILLDGGDSRPWGMDVFEFPGAEKIYVADRDDIRVFVIDAQTRTVDGEVVVGSTPIDVAIDTSSQRAFVTNSGSNNISVIDVVGDPFVVDTTFNRTGLQQPWGIAVNETTDKIFVASYYNGEIFVFEGLAGGYAYITEIQVFGAPSYIEVNEDDNMIYVSHSSSVNYVTIIDGDTYEVVDAMSFADQVHSVTYNSSLGFYYVSLLGLGKVAVFEAGTNEELSDSPLSGFINPRGIATIDSGIAGGGTTYWHVGLVDSAAGTFNQILTTETYPPVFDGLESAVDAGDPITPTVNLQWDPATDTSTPISYYVYTSATQSMYTVGLPDWTTMASGPVSYTAGLNYGDKLWFMVHAVDSAFPPNEELNLMEHYVVVSDGAAPTGGELTSAVDTTQGREVDLVWNAAIDFSPPITYKIFVATFSGNYNWDIPYTTVSGTTTYTLDNLGNNTEYFFVVRAADISDLTSTNTVELSATPTDIVAPAFLGLDTLGDDATGGTVNLSWDPATDNSDPIKYNIYYNQGVAISSYATPQASLTGQTVTQISGLENDVQYVFAVRAEDSEGNEDANMVTDTITPTDPVFPDFDGIYSCSDEGNDDEIELIWFPASDKSLPITYNVYYATQSGVVNYNFLVPNFQTQSSIYIASGTLTMGQEYYFIVRAKDGAGNEEANVVEKGPCIPTDGDAPEFDGIQTATASWISGEVSLSWNSGTDSSPLPLTYNVYQATVSGAQEFGTPSFQTGATSATVGALVDGTTYYYVVRAEDAGQLEDSNTTELSAIPNDGQAPVFTGISSLDDTGISSTLYAEWAPATDTSLPITYNIFVAEETSSLAYTEAPYMTTAATGADIEDLIDNTGYYVVVRALDGGGVTSTHTTPLFATPTDSTPPTFSGVQSVFDTTKGGELTVLWNTVTNEPSLPAMYYIYMATSANPIDYVTPVANTRNLSYTVKNLENEVMHKFGVWAADNAIPPNMATNATVLAGTPTDDYPPSFDGLKSAVGAEGQDNAILISWDEASDTSEPITYLIYYHTSNTPASILAQGIRATTTAASSVITGLTPGNYTYFLVRAQDAYGNNDSNVIVKGAVPQDLAAPDFDGLQTVLNTTEGGEVDLAWDAASDVSTPIQYNIYYTTDLADCTDTVDLPEEPGTTMVTTLDLTYSLTSLQDDTGYCFAVGAKDAADNETLAGEYLFATPTDQTPPTFGGLSSVTDTTEGGELLLSWTAATDNSEPIYYNIYEAQTPGGLSFSTPTYQAQSTDSYTVSGATDGQVYYYVVTAEDSSSYANESATAAALWATPTDTTPPVFSGLISVDTKSENGVAIVSWSTATDNTSPIYYNVYKADVSNQFGGFATPYTTVSGTTTALVTDLIHNRRYFFVVRAQDSAVPPNETQNTTETDYRFKDEVAPSPPTNIQIEAADVSCAATGDEYIKLSWASPTTNVDDSPVVDLAGYDIYRSVEDGTSYDTNPNRVDGVYDDMLPAFATSYSDSYSLTLGQTYYYVLVAYDDAGNYDELSAQVYTQVAACDEKTPMPPANLEAEGSEGKVALSWDAPQLNTDASALEDLKGFYVRRSETKGANYALISGVITPVEEGKEEYDDTNVVDGTPYYYVVTAMDTADPVNESAYSNEAWATPGVQLDYPPAAPSGLEVTANNGNAYLVWVAPSKNSDGSSIGSDLDGYNVYRSQGDATSSAMVNTTLVTSPSYNDADLESGKYYFYYVTAVDGAGQESASSSVVVGVYGDNGVTGNIQYRDPEDLLPTGYNVYGLSGMEVYLVDSEGETLVSTLTDDNGDFTLIYADAEVGVPYEVRMTVYDGTGFPYDELTGEGVGYMILSEDVYIQETGFIDFDTVTLGVGPTIGDFDCDGVITFPDLYELKISFNSSFGQPEYNPNTDADGDGIITFPDLSILKNSFNSTTMSLPEGACD